jgi:hypothetical protein
MDLARHEQARARNADLPRMGKHRHGGDRHGPVYVGIAADNHRRLAAELQRNPFQVADGGTGDRLPGYGGAGKDDLVDIGMFGEPGAGDRTPPVTILTTPSGTPASCMSLAIKSGVSGASS